MASPFFLNELFWSLISLIGVGIAIIFEMRKNRGLFERLSNLFSDSIQITLDERQQCYTVMHNLYHKRLIKIKSI